MTPLLPLFALALAFATPFLSRSERDRIDLPRLGALALLVVAASVVAFRPAPEIDRTPALVGLALGALACALGAWGGGLAFGVAAASGLHLLPATSLPAAGLALVAGTGLGALAVGGEASALAAVLVVAADNLGMRHSPVPAAAFAGSQAGVALAVAALLAAWTPTLSKRLDPLRPILAGVVVATAGFFVAKSSGDASLTACVGLGAIAGVVLHFLMPNEEGESPRVGLAAVVGIALGAVAFGYGKGLGMGVAALAAVGVLLASESRRAVLALGPLVGLVLYRVLREAGTGATRAIDLAQHYTLLALVLGLALPLLPVDWLAVRRGSRAIGVLLWGFAALAAPLLVVVALGQRGGIGFVVGLGVAGLVQALRSPFSSPRERPTERQDSRPGDEGRASAHDLQPLALGAGLAGATILALAWLGDESTLARAAKLHLFAEAAVGIAVLALLLAFAGRSKKREAL